MSMGWKEGNKYLFWTYSITFIILQVHQLFVKIVCLPVTDQIDTNEILANCPAGNLFLL